MHKIAYPIATLLLSNEVRFACADFRTVRMLAIPTSASSENKYPVAHVRKYALTALTVHILVEFLPLR